MYHGSPEYRAELRRTAMRPVDEDDMISRSKKPRMHGRQTAETFPVVITTYDMIIRDRRQLAGYQWGYIVVDEGHRLKNFNCKLMQEIKKYSSAGRMILTGTPLHVSILMP